MRAALALALLSSLTAYADKPDLATRPALPPPPVWRAPVPTTTTWRDHPVVLLQRPELPLVHVLVTVPAGSAFDPPDRPGLAAAVATMLQDGGTGSRTAKELAQAFADLGAELEEHVDADQVQLEVTVLARNLAPALDLLRSVLRDPRLGEDDWQRAQARRIDEIHRRLDQPEHLADDVFERVLYGDHPYGHPFIGTVEAVRAITVDDLRSFWSEHYTWTNITFVLVGDVDNQALRPQHVTDAKSQYPQSKKPVPPPPPTPLPPRVVLVDRPGASQSEIRVGHLGVRRGTPDFAALTLLETVLGGTFTSRLNQNLREKHGYTYGARAQFDMRTVTGPFVAAAGVRTDATAAALTETVAEISGMRAPLQPDELQKGRAVVMHTIVEAFSDGNETAGYLADLVAHRLPLDSWSKLPAELAALDPAGLARVAAYAFRPDALTIVVVGDRKQIEAPLRKLPFVKSLEILTP